MKKARQEKFSDEVGSSSWDEAIATLPQFIEHIESFKGYSNSEAFKLLNNYHMNCIILKFYLHQLCGDETMAKSLENTSPAEPTALSSLQLSGIVK